MEKTQKETLSYKENQSDMDVIYRHQCGTSGQVCLMTAKLNNTTASLSNVANLVGASACQYFAKRISFLPCVDMRPIYCLAYRKFKNAGSYLSISAFK